MKTILFLKSYYGIIPEGTKVDVIDKDGDAWILEGFATEVPREQGLGVYVKSFVDLQVMAIKKKKFAEYKAVFDLTYREEKSADKEQKHIYVNKRFDIVSNYIIDEYEVKTIRDSDVEEYWYKLNGVYVPNGRTLIEEVCHLFYINSLSAAIINKVQLLIRVKTFVDRDFFFQNVDKTRIAFANGIFNFRTWNLESNTNITGTNIFNFVPVKYDENAKCPNFELFIGDILIKKEDIDTIQELFGFCLLPHYKFEKLFILTGNGRNGKSKLLQIAKTLLGQHNTVSHGLKTLQEKEFAKADLHCKLANVGGDISRGALKETDVIKELTGQDLITANRKFKSYVMFTNYSKQVFACNELPAIYDSSLGFWNRIIRLDFPYTFYEKGEYDKLENKTFAKIRKENILDNILNEQELSGILNWALVGLKRLLDKNQFSNTADTLQVRNEWLRRSSSFFAFVEDVCVFDKNSRIENNVLNDLYGAYCEHYECEIVRIEDRREQLNTLANKAINIVVSRDVDGNRTRYWKGLKIKDEVLQALGIVNEKLITDMNLDQISCYDCYTSLASLNLTKKNYKNTAYESDVADVAKLRMKMSDGTIPTVCEAKRLKLLISRNLYDTLLDYGHIVEDGENARICLPDEEA